MVYIMRLEFSYMPFLLTNCGLMAYNRLKDTKSIFVKERSKQKRIDNRTLRIPVPTEQHKATCSQKVCRAEN